MSENQQTFETLGEKHTREAREHSEWVRKDNASRLQACLAALRNAQSGDPENSTQPDS